VLGRVWHVVALAGPALMAGAFAAGFGQARELGAYLMLALAAAVITSALWVAIFSSFGDRSGQRARDIEAQAIFNALERGEAPSLPFVLYLRPFISTGDIQEQVMSPMIIGLGQGVVFGGADLELERQIQRAARKIGRLVGLGKPGEHIGAGRIRVDDEVWQDAVRLLSDHAKLIVLLPSSRKGTMWEVRRLLCTGLISKTVVIDPPNAAVGKFKHPAEWAALREAFATAAYTLPEDDKAGQLLFFHDARRPVVRAQLDMDAEDAIAAFFRKVGEIGGRKMMRG
jgi:hypothetical protein